MDFIWLVSQYTIDTHKIQAATLEHLCPTFLLMTSSMTLNPAAWRMFKNPSHNQALGLKGINVTTVCGWPALAPALPHNVSFLMKTKMDFRNHADFFFFFLPVCFQWSHWNGSVFYLYKNKRNKAALVQLVWENCAKHDDLLPARRNFYLGSWTDPREG